MITLAEAKNLSYGDILHHVSEKNADGTPMRARVTGKVQTWKTRDDFRIPVKHGLKECFYISNIDHSKNLKRTDVSHENWEVA